MALFVTLGGDRIGSGEKQKVELHNYGMNSFNLEQDFKSSMAPGVLYPFIKMIGTNHGTFDIDLDTFVRTIPTRGPLFGSFKLQIDLFSVPFRLYQGVLHNNPVNIGLNMNQVYLPKIKVATLDYKGAPRPSGSNNYNYQINDSALLKYLGLSGIGRKSNRISSGNAVRKFNAVPILAYYDIFKCYYSNKQEENAYVISVNDELKAINLINEAHIQNYFGGIRIKLEQDGYNFTAYVPDAVNEDVLAFRIDIEINNNNNLSKSELLNSIGIEIPAAQIETELDTFLANNTNVKTVWNETNTALSLYFYTAAITSLQLDPGDEIILNGEDEYFGTNEIAIKSFKLANIDDMRNFLLSNCTLGTEVTIENTNKSTTVWGNNSGTDSTGLPYSCLVNTTTEGITYNAFTMNGLMLKTYQSDLFNNWLDTEFIDGESGISAITSVDTTNGSFTMDSLNLAEKFYELLNRILVSGGTYQDWQEAVYGEGAIRMCETPMYIGGMSSEICFEEVISSAETNVSGDFQALGSLAGKGQQVGKKGGNNIHVKMDEPGYVIGIVSITPRISYSQGNDWDLTDLDTLDDLHKPALDGIGFQPIMVEQFAWWDTTIIQQQANRVQRNSAGKQIAWINYQTAVDKCFGDFAKQDGYSFMVLNRNYEMEINEATDVATVKDITTYIDPAKFNYAFAYNDLAAQNFWVQIHSKVTARRKMGAQQIPNL